MKIKMLSVFLITIYISMPLTLYAQGTLVANGVVVNFDGLFSPNEIDVLHNPANPTSGGSYTGFDLNPNGKTPPNNPVVNTFSFNPVLDVGVRVFQVSANDPISLQPILSMNYTELTFPNSYVFQNNQPEYLGLYTGNQSSAPPNGIYSDPLFGWAEVENVNGTIKLLNSALEYQGGGIIAGTDTIIPAPEPSTWALLLCGASLLGIGHKWHRR